MNNASNVIMSIVKTYVVARIWLKPLLNINWCLNEYDIVISSVISVANTMVNIIGF